MVYLWLWYCLVLSDQECVCNKKKYMDEILKQTKVDWEVCDPTTNDIKQYQLSWYMELSPFMLEEEEEEEEEGEEERRWRTGQVMGGDEQVQPGPSRQ